MKKISNNLYNAIEFYNKNKTAKTITEIANIFKVDRHSIIKHLNDCDKYKYHYQGYYYYLSEKEEESVLYFIENHDIPMIEIKRKFGCNSDTIKRRMKVMGYVYETRYLRTFNRNAFSSINTEEDAYWLGFILMDGYLNEDRGVLRVKLGEKDIKHLKKFANYMGDQDCDIKYDVGGAISRDNICPYLQYSCRTISDNLTKLNVFQNKSKKERPIDLKDYNLKKSYIRGMIDADGHVKEGYFKFVGSYESCEYMKKFFDEYYHYPFKEKNKYIYKHGSIYSFEINSKAVTEILIDLYKNSKIYLERKYLTLIK